MFRWLQWLFLFGAFAGLGLRASGAHFDFCPPGESEVSCCGDGFAASSGHSDEHCPECPQVPHHHGHQHGDCCHVGQWLPLIADATLFPPWGEKSEVRILRERPPEAPVMPLDKPPLI